MSEDFEKRLDFDSDTFEEMKKDMNFVLQRLIGNMQEKGTNEGSMTFGKERMSSYVDRGNKLIASGKIQKAMKLVERGLQHYSEKIINAISPYAKADAGLIVLVLRHLADEVERGNPGAKELYEGMKKCVNAPELSEIEKVRKANRY